MIKLLTAKDANWNAKQRTFVTGLLETVIYPKIHHDSCYGLYDTKVMLDQYEACVPETAVRLIETLQKHGYIVKLKGKTLFIDWK